MMSWSLIGSLVRMSCDAGVTPQGGVANAKQTHTHTRTMTEKDLKSISNGNKEGEAGEGGVGVGGNCLLTNFWRITFAANTHNNKANPP